MFLQDANGNFKRCADGFLVCLGDGIRKEEWTWLKEHWDLGFGALPKRIFGVTAVWSDSAFHSSLASYIATGMPDDHRLIYPLMENGVQIQSYVRVEDIKGSSGPLLILNQQLLPKNELMQLLDYGNGPIIMIGGRRDDLPKPDIFIEDAPAADSMVCLIYATGHLKEVLNLNPEKKEPAAYKESRIPLKFREELIYREFSDQFIQCCSGKIAEVANSIGIKDNRGDAVL